MIGCSKLLVYSVHMSMPSIFNVSSICCKHLIMRD